MVNKIISYMNYCRIKDELQERIDEDMKHYGLDNNPYGSSRSLRTIYVTDRNKPHEMLVEFGIGISSMQNLTPNEVVKLIIVLDYASARVEKVNKSYKGYRYEF